MSAGPPSNSCVMRILTHHRAYPPKDAPGHTAIAENMAAQPYLPSKILRGSAAQNLGGETVSERGWDYTLTVSPASAAEVLPACLQ